MSCKCNTAKYLNAVVVKESQSENLVGAAKATLRMIDDMHGRAMNNHDVTMLHDMVAALMREGHGALLNSVLESAPDCRVCAEIAFAIRKGNGAGDLIT